MPAETARGARRAGRLLGLLLAAGLASAAVAQERFSFLAYGDNRAGNGCAGNAVHLAIVKRLLREPGDLVFNLGDMVTGYDRSTNWVQRGDCQAADSHGSFKEAIAPLQARKPAPGLPTFYFPVIGNHDDNWGDGWYPDKFGDGFCDVFDPGAFISNHTGGPHVADRRWPRLDDAEFRTQLCSKTRRGAYPDLAYYAFSHRSVRFIVLRLNGDYHDLEACNRPCHDTGNYDRFYNRHQLDWLTWQLEQAGADPRIRHVVVLLHAPLLTGSWGHAANVSWPTLSRLFSRHGVRLVLSGHNHVYERSVPVVMDEASPEGRRDDRAGTTYVVTGGGGSPLHGFNRRHPLVAQALSEHHFLRIDVDGDDMRVTALRPDGSVLDRQALPGGARSARPSGSAEVVVPVPAGRAPAPLGREASRRDGP